MFDADASEGVALRVRPTSGAPASLLPRATLFGPFGIDNDGDGPIDFPNDVGCTSADDLSENRECSDGFDNGGDGFADLAGGDVGCATEDPSVQDPACDDGRDNDLDGAIDADGGAAGPADSHCAGVPSKTAEAPSGCGIGPEPTVLLPLLAGALRIRRRRWS